MKYIRITLWLLIFATISAGLWLLFADDTGYIMIQKGNWVLETSLFIAFIAIFALIVLNYYVFRFIQWPWRALRQRSKQRYFSYFTQGLVFTLTGRLTKAESRFASCSQSPDLKIPALIKAYEVAQLRQQNTQEHWLEKLRQETITSELAIILHAENQLMQGHIDAAETTLSGLLTNAHNIPAVYKIKLDIALAREQPEIAMDILDKLRREPPLGTHDWFAYTVQVLIRAMRSAKTGEQLQILWNQTDIQQKHYAPLIICYAEQANQLGMSDTAMREFSKSLKKQWSTTVVSAWAILDSQDHKSCIKQGESWLRDHPEDAMLLFGLGRYCRKESLFGKAGQYLQQALHAGAGARAHMQLGHLYKAQQLPEKAMIAYANALKEIYGQESLSVTERSAAIFHGKLTPELRNDHGVPVLPINSINRIED